MVDGERRTFAQTSCPKTLWDMAFLSSLFAKMVKYCEGRQRKDNSERHFHVWHVIVAEGIEWYVDKKKKHCCKQFHTSILKPQNIPEMKYVQLSEIGLKLYLSAICISYVAKIHFIQYILVQTFSYWYDQTFSTSSHSHLLSNGWLLTESLGQLHFTLLFSTQLNTW